MLPTPSHHHQHHEDRQSASPAEEDSNPVLPARSRTEPAALRTGSEGDRRALREHSVHFGNLPDRLRKDFVRRQLYHLCVPFGSILDVVVQRTPRMRGQAFVVFERAADARQCQRMLQGVVFHGKPVRTALANAPSRALLQHQEQQQLKVQSISPSSK
jgi:RNA recognition motif-containing protein